MYSARYFFIILGLILMIYIFMAVRKRKLTIDFSILWIIGAIAIFIIGCFPDIIIWLADIIGIAYPPSLLFLLSIAFLLLLSLNNSLIISELKEKNKELIQNSAILDERLRQLEKRQEEEKK